MSSPARSRQVVAVWAAPACSAVVEAADIIVSAQDGKFVRVEGRAAFPLTAPPHSLAVLDASQSRPVIEGILEGIEQTFSGMSWKLGPAGAAELRRAG